VYGLDVTTLPLPPARTRSLRARWQQFDQGTKLLGAGNDMSEASSLEYHRRFGL